MKTIQIGLPCTPASIISHETIEGKKILVSYGGGIGGVSKFHHCTAVIEMRDPKEPTILRLILLSGEVIEVNPLYVVEKYDRKYVKLVSDITGHKNFYGKVCSKAIRIEFIELQYDENYLILEESHTSRESIAYWTEDVTE